jgi:hypothetical protein
MSWLGLGEASPKPHPNLKPTANRLDPGLGLSAGTLSPGWVGLFTLKSTNRVVLIGGLLASVTPLLLGWLDEIQCGSQMWWSSAYKSPDPSPRPDVPAERPNPGSRRLGFLRFEVGMRFMWLADGMGLGGLSSRNRIPSHPNPFDP